MKKNLTLLSMLVGALGLVTAGGGSALAGGASCSAQTASETTCGLTTAMQQAQASHLPVLIKVGTEWCSACQKFEKDKVSNADFRAAIGKNAVLHTVDAEKGTGIEIAKAYHIESYPTYVLANSDGEVLDRWTGYSETDEFLKTLATACDNPVTVEERAARFRNHPTEADAAKLAELRLADGLYGEANALFQRAAELNPKAEASYAYASFQAVAKGTHSNVFDLADARHAADRVLATKGTQDADLLRVAYMMRKVAGKAGDDAAGLPYLKAAVERTANTKDSAALEMRAMALPDYALNIQKDLNRALELKKASLGEDWMETAKGLNNFAWWCFENRVNLDEAEQLARKGVELAKAGVEKANVLDTLAELCNLQGNCGDSVHLIEMAIAEAPDNDYFRNQLTRFQELVAMQN